MPKSTKTVVEPIVVENVKNFDELTKVIKTLSSALNSISKKLQVDENLYHEVSASRESERFQRTKNSFVFTEQERNNFLETFLCDMEDIPYKFDMEDLVLYTNFNYVLEKVPDIEEKVTTILQNAYEQISNLLPPAEKRKEGSFAIRRSKFKKEEESNSEPEVDKS